MNILRIAFLALSFSLCGIIVAQPPRRRAEQQQKQEQARNAPAKGSAYREFPTAQSMPQDAAWRRDLYRTIDLTRDANAVLYYPTTPQDGRENLFTYLFHLILRGQVKAYDYKLDGNEDFSAKNQVKAKDIMDRYHIFYESKDGRMRVNDVDLPSDEVKAYFIKESTYYDQHTASFRTQVTALCPVLKRGDSDFGGELSQYPMFWVKMSEVAPYLGKLMLMGSSLNNAATMSADDFFTLHRYEGDIYKAVNLQDRLLSNYCPDDSSMAREQKRIEKQLTDVQEHVWGRDSAYYARLRADSIAQAQADSLAAAGKTSRTSRSTASPTRRTTTARRTSVSSKSSAPKQQSAPKATKPKKQKTVKPKSSSSRGGGYSVRRQRH